jgi:hypothetical protein
MFKKELPELVFNLAVLILMTAAAIFTVYRYGANIPFVDDWALVPHLAAGEPLTLDWLLSQHNEHRYPLTRALFWIFWQIQPGYLKYSMYLHVLILASVALAAQNTARVLRGSRSYADAVFPCVLLHGGQAENFLWWIQSFFILSSAFIVLSTCLLARGQWLQRRNSQICLAFLLCCLPLTGAIGVVIATVLVLGILVTAASELFRGEKPVPARLYALFIVPLAGLLFIILYFRGFHFVERHLPADNSIFSRLSRGVEVLATSFGVFGTRGWPISGVLVVGLVLWTCVNLALANRTTILGRGRVAGIGLSLAALLGLAFAIGWGRESGLATRYIILSSPLICIAYLSMILRDKSALSSFGQMSIFAAMCAATTYHMHCAVDFGKQRQAAVAGFMADLQEHIPPTGLAGRHAAYWCWNEEPMRQGLELLSAAGVFPYATIPADPTFNRRALALAPNQLVGGQGNAGVLKIENFEARIIYSFGQSNKLSGLSLKLRVTDHINEIRLKAAFYNVGQRVVTTREQSPLHPLKLSTGGPTETCTFWCDGVVDSVEFVLQGGPCSIEMLEITLLMPDSELTKE